jgi:hypothetical protein
VTYLEEQGGAFSTVVETLTGDCLRCTNFSASEQTFTFTNALQSAPLRAYRTRIGNHETEGYMVDMGFLEAAADGSYSIELGVDEIWTLTTAAELTKVHDDKFLAPQPEVPQPAPFPLPFQASFDEPQVDAFGRPAADGVANGKYFSDQVSERAKRESGAGEARERSEGQKGGSESYERCKGAK